MKKCLLIILIFFVAKPACAQWFPINIEQSITSYGYFFPSNNEQMLVNDSMIYLLRYGGIEVMNMNTRVADYRWSKCYNAGIIKPDTGANFMIVKNNTQIVCYNFAADSFYNVPQPFSGTVDDIGRSNSYIWALISGHILGRFNGNNWIFDTLQSTGSTSTKLMVKDDSTAYTLSPASNRVCSYQHNLFNYGFATLHLNRLTDPCEIDSRGNLWIADSIQLLEVDSLGGVTNFGAGNNSFTAVQALNVLTDNNGHVWATGSYGTVCEYNGQTWTSYTLQNNAEGLFTGIDKTNDSLYAWYFDDNLYKISNTGQSVIPITNMPYQGITALNGYYIATTGGIFKFEPFSGSYSPVLIPADFIDTSRAGNPYPFDVTCIINGNSMQYLDTAHSFLYGTHHGVYGLNGLIDNSQLPDTTINCLYYADNVLYIGTNKGLCIYRNHTYTNYDTSNSPLPSNKVQCISLNWIYNNPYVFDSALYVGTNNGLAVLRPSGWKVYDTAYFNLSSLCVTGILPTSSYSYNPYDSTTFISTLGSGLIALKTDGSYILYNKANGYSPSDSIYNLSFQDMGGCGAYLVAAMPGAGFAFEPNYAVSFIPLQSYLNYQMVLPDSSPFRFFCAFQNNTSNYYDAITLFSQGTGLADTYAAICEGLPVVTAPTGQLKWNYESNMLKVFLPGNYSGYCTLTIYDIEGKMVAFVTGTVVGGDPVSINVNRLAAGMYIVKAALSNTTLQTKAIITR